MIKWFAANPTADSPWRNNKARHSETGADGKSVHIFKRRPFRRGWRDDVIENPIILVIADDKYRLRPQIRIRGNRVQLAGNESRSRRRHIIGMLALLGSGNDPGHFRQFVVERIVFKLTFRPAHHAAPIQ